MARHGENIRKRKDGRWEGRYPVYKEDKGKKIYHSLYGKSYEEVKNKLLAVKCRNQDMDMTQENGWKQGVLFETAAMHWLTELPNKNKPSTCVKYKLIYQKYLAATLGEHHITAISSRLLEERLPGRLSDSLIKSIYCVVNQILQYSCRTYGSPVKKITRQASRGKGKPVEVLTKTEQTRLFSVLCLRQDVYKMAVALSLYTGLRIGEICALKWEDIDFKNRLIYVRRTVQRIPVNDAKTKTQLIETAPKSEHSKREIPISSMVWELLGKLNHKKPYLFGGDKPMEPRTLQYRFKKLLKESEVSDKNFHILRHTFATNCMEEGADAKSLSELLGHSDVQITLNRYVHPSLASKRKQLERLMKIYGQIYGQAG